MLHRPLVQIQELVDDALAKGAKALLGGKIGAASGQFYQPTVLVDVTPEMRIWSEEVFGPVLTIIKVQNDAEVRRSTAHGPPTRHELSRRWRGGGGLTC